MKPFLSESNAIIQIYMGAIMKETWVSEEFWSYRKEFFAGSQQNAK